MKSFLSLMCILISTCAFSQEKLEFTNASWSDILSIAKSTNKLVFVDAYTTWCAPCKQMDKVTFKEEEVTQFFNANFVNVKIDMEKGEGIELSGKYGIAAFPTLLFVDPSGKAIHRGLGFHDAKQLLALAQIAMNGSETLSAMQAKFDKGNRDPEFVSTLIDKSFEMQNGAHLPIAEAYFFGENKMNEEEKMDFVYSYLTDTDTKLFDYLIKNKTKFFERFGKEQVESKISDLIYLESNLEMKPEELSKLDALFKKANPKTAKKESANFRMAYFRQKGDRLNFAKSAKTYMKFNKGAKAPELNDLAWTFYQVVEDKKLLKSAIKWAKKSVALAPKGYAYETLASLYNKSGDQTKAIQSINTGIAQSQALNEDTTSLEELLTIVQASTQEK